MINYKASHREANIQINVFVRFIFCVSVCMRLPGLARDSMSPGQLPVEINVRIDCHLCHTVPNIIVEKVERQLIAEQQTDTPTGWTMKSCREWARGERQWEREKKVTYYAQDKKYIFLSHF